MDHVTVTLKPRESLQRRIAFGIGVPLLIAFLAMVIIQARYDRDLLVEKIRQEIRAEAEVACLKLQSDLLAIEHAVGIEAELLRAEAGEVGAIDSPASRRAMSALLKAVVGASPNVFGAAIAFAPGQPGVPAQGMAPYVCRGGSDGPLRETDLAMVPGYDFPKQEWFVGAALAPKGRWSEPYFDTGGGNVFMTTYSMRFPAVGALPSGVVTADLALDQMLEGAALGDSASIYEVSVISGMNRFLASTLAGAEMKAAGDFAADDLRGEVLAAVAAFRKDGKEFAQIGEGGAFGISAIRAVFVKVPATDWILAGTFRDVDLLPPIVTLLALGPGLLVVGVVGALYLVWRTTSRAFRPLAGVVAAIERFGSGDLSARAPEPKRYDEIGMIARAFNAMGSALGLAIADRNRAEAEKMAVAAQVAAARGIQRLLLPEGDKSAPDGDVRAMDGFAGLSIAAMSTPAADIAGDFFDWFARDDGTVVIVIADVCGKGMPAAMMMAVGRTLIRRAAAELADPGAVMARVSNDLMTEAPSSAFTTAMVLFIDAKSGRVQYANAGHPSAAIVRANGSVESAADSTGTVLGIEEDAKWGVGRIDMYKGDQLVLVSDGVTEAGPEEGGSSQDQTPLLFGDERSREAIAQACAVSRNPRKTMGALAAAVAAFSGGYQRDDMTILVLEMTAGPES